MHFDLTSDQRALAEGMRELCTRQFPMDTVQALEGTGFD